MALPRLASFVVPLLGLLVSLNSARGLEASDVVKVEFEGEVASFPKLKFPSKARLERDWLGGDLQDALREKPLDDCRWIPCYDYGVCPGLGLEHQNNFDGAAAGAGTTTVPAGRTRPPLHAGPR